MAEKEYTVEISNNLKVSGSAETIHELAIIYNCTACSYGQAIIDEIHNKHRDTLIAELINKQRKFENIEKQLIDVIRDSDYYKEYSFIMSEMTNNILEEIELEK